MKFITIFTLIVILTAIQACHNSKDSKETAEEHNDAKFSYTDHQKQDAEFLVTAAEMNLEGIMLGQLAQQNSMMIDVKELGKMIEKARKKSMTDLVALAKKKLVTIPMSPTEHSRNIFEKLKKKSGKEFDKNYCSLMVDGHKDAISAFEKESKESNDPDIQGWANETIPNLRLHLDYAITCKKECEKF